MKKPTLSIIIPVYKVEKYLPTCIESILAQSFTDFELLLIDDGSPDSSGKICDEYASKDNRIRSIHKTNAGVSAARNTGLEYAKGEWITFVDSDDWLEAGCFQTCIDHIRKYNLDLLQFSYKRISDQFKELFRNQNETQVLSTSQYISADKFLYCAGGSFLKNDIIKQNKLRFETHLKLGEDQLFMYGYIASCNLCMRIKELFYNYRYNNESASAVSNPQECIISIKAFQNFPLRKLFERQIQKNIYVFLLHITKSNIFSISQTLNLIKTESFNQIIPKRKIDFIFFQCYKISKHLGIIILHLLKNKI